MKRKGFNFDKMFGTNLQNILNQLYTTHCKLPEIHVPLNPLKENRFGKMSSNPNGIFSVCLGFATGIARVQQIVR